MDWLKIFGGPQFAVMLIPGICMSVGMSLKNKDDNRTGLDDLGGDVIISLGPILPAFLDGNPVTVRKVLTAARNTIDNYLTNNPAPAAGTPTTSGGGFNIPFVPNM